MKTYYRIFLSLTALVLLTLTSCFDDAKYDVTVPGYDKVPYVVDFNESPNSGGFIIRSFAGTTDPAFEQEATFTVNLSSPFKLDHSIDLTIEFDQAAIDAFIVDNPSWTALPVAKQDFSSETVTIPADEREVTFTVNFLTEGLSADDLIVSAYTITNVSDPDVIISGNFGTQFVKVGVANVFEGDYVLSGNFWTNPSRTSDYTGYMADPVHLITNSSTASELSYFYAGWGDKFVFDVDLANPATIDGHAGAYPVTVTTAGWASDDQEQMDAYDAGADGTVWNYCYQEGGKWIFKACHEAGGWFGYATYTQQ